MAIKKTITNAFEFAEWVKQSDSYSNNFTFDGAIRLQEYLEQLSDDIGEDFEFDPIAWCCEYSEYDNFEDFQLNGGYDENSDIKTIEDLEDRTTVIEMENGGLIIQEF